MPQLSKDLKTGVYRTEFEIDAEEYHAIGRVTAQWAYLEHGVFAMTKAITTASKVELPTDALNTSFKRRLTAYRRAVEEFVLEPERTRLLKLHGKIANAEADRHRITHGMWEWDKNDPERISASSFRPGFEFEKFFNAARINKLADTIGTITAAMEYPEGFKSLLEDYADEDGNAAFFHISRRLHRLLKDGLNRYPPDDDQATTPENKTPQSSLKG